MSTSLLETSPATISFCCCKIPEKTGACFTKSAAIIAIILSALACFTCLLFIMAQHLPRLGSLHAIAITVDPLFLYTSLGASFVIGCLNLVICKKSTALTYPPSGNQDGNYSLEFVQEHLTKDQWEEITLHRQTLNPGTMKAFNMQMTNGSTVYILLIGYSDPKFFKELSLCQKTQNYYGLLLKQIYGKYGALKMIDFKAVKVRAEKDYDYTIFDVGTSARYLIYRLDNKFWFKEFASQDECTQFLDQNKQYTLVAE